MLKPYLLQTRMRESIPKKDAKEFGKRTEPRTGMEICMIAYIIGRQLV